MLAQNRMDGSPAPSSPINWSDSEVARFEAAELLNHYAQDRMALAALVERSMADPRLARMSEIDEFRLKFVLADELDSGFRLRLHVWRDQVTDTPHSHRFSYASMVLSGGVTHTVHEANQDLYPDGIQGVYDEHLLLTDGRVKRLINPKLFKTVMSFPVVAGSSYFQSSDVPLTSTVVHAGTVTLFVRGPAVRDCAFQWHPDRGTVIWRAGTSHAPASRRSEVVTSPDETARALARLRQIGIG